MVSEKLCQELETANFRREGTAKDDCIDSTRLRYIMSCSEHGHLQAATNSSSLVNAP